MHDPSHEWMHGAELRANWTGEAQRSGRTDICSAQQALGHKDLKTTDIYVRGGVGEKVMPTQ